MNRFFLLIDIFHFTFEGRIVPVLLRLCVSSANVRINMFDYYSMYVFHYLIIHYPSIALQIIRFSVLYALLLDTTLLNVKMKNIQLWSRVLIYTPT